MTSKMTAVKPLLPWIALCSGLFLGWLLMHLIATNWNSLKAMFA